MNIAADRRYLRSINALRLAEENWVTDSAGVGLVIIRASVEDLRREKKVIGRAATPNKKGPASSLAVEETTAEILLAASLADHLQVGDAQFTVFFFARCLLHLAFFLFFALFCL